MPRLHNVQFSPNYENDGTIFTATWWDVLKSTDRGVSWTTIPVGTGPRDLRQFVIAVSPQYATDGTVYVGTRQGEIYRSTAQGAANTWTLMANVGSQIRSLVLNPAFSTEPVLYASTFVRIYKSVNAGSSWQPTSPPGISMLAISPNYQTDGSLFAGTPSGVFVTRDKGASWTELTAPPLSTTTYVEAIGVSPGSGTNQTVLVSVLGKGLFRSTDAGNTFSEVATSLIASNFLIGDFDNPTSAPIQFSPFYEQDQTIFAMAQQNILKSTNRGASWQVLTLPPASNIIQPPKIAAAPTAARVVEGANGTTRTVRVTFDLSHPYASAVTVQWQTADSAEPGYASSATGDFVAASGTLTYSPGTTRQFVDVVVKGDSLDEADESVLVSLRNATNATITGTGAGAGVIQDDDPLPTVSPGWGFVTEGDAGNCGAHRPGVALGRVGSIGLFRLENRRERRARWGRLRHGVGNGHVLARRTKQDDPGHGVR